jgi:hypothetical protein
MAGRTPAAIEEWKNSDVIMVVSHGTITGSPAPTIPTPDHLVLQTGTIEQVVMASVLGPLVERFAPANKDEFYDSLFGANPLETLSEDVANQIKILSVAAGAPEKTLAKRHSYNLDRDARLGVGVYLIRDGIPIKITLGPIDTRLQQPGGIETKDLLDLLYQFTEEGRKTTILLVSCSSVHGESVHESTMQVGEEQESGRNKHLIISSSPRNLPASTGRKAGAPSRPTSKPKGETSKNRIYNPETGEVEGFHPDANVETLPTSNPYQRHKQPTKKYTITRDEPSRVVRSKQLSRAYYLVVVSTNGHTEYYNDNGRPIQFTNSVDMYAYLKANNRGLAEDARLFSQQSPKRYLMIRKLITPNFMGPGEDRTMTLGQFKKEFEASWASICSGLSCGLIKYGGRRKTRHRAKRGLNASTRRNK